MRPGCNKGRLESRPSATASSKKKCDRGGDGLTIIFPLMGPYLHRVHHEAVRIEVL